MNIRLLAITIFALFALAPTALAVNTCFFDVATNKCSTGCYSDDNAQSGCSPISTASTPCTDNGDGTWTCSAGANNTQTTGVKSSTQTTGVKTGAGNITLINPLGTGTTLNSLLASILQFVVRIGAIIVVFMLIYVGFLFVKAQGEPGKITEARQALLWTIVGALILLGAEAIAAGIQATVSALSTGG